MATPGPGRKQFDPKKESHVGVMGTAVTREEFWVSHSRKEVAEWFCQQDHTHGEKHPCFIVRFNKDGSPFKSSVFTSDSNGYACSDDIVVAASPTIYKYSVEANGHVQDPGGGVKP